MPLLLFALFLVLFCPLFYSALDRVLSLTLFAFGILLSFVPSCIWPPAAQESYLLYPPNLIFFKNLLSGPLLSVDSPGVLMPIDSSCPGWCLSIHVVPGWCLSIHGVHLPLVMTCHCCSPALAACLLKAPFC